MLFTKKRSLILIGIFLLNGFIIGEQLHGDLMLDKTKLRQHQHHDHHHDDLRADAVLHLHSPTTSKLKKAVCLLPSLVSFILSNPVAAFTVPASFNHVTLSNGFGVGGPPSTGHHHAALGLPMTASNEEEDGDADLEKSSGIHYNDFPSNFNADESNLIGYSNSNRLPLFPENNKGGSLEILQELELGIPVYRLPPAIEITKEVISSLFDEGTSEGFAHVDFTSLFPDGDFMEAVRTLPTDKLAMKFQDALNEKFDGTEFQVLAYWLDKNIDDSGPTCSEHHFFDRDANKKLLSGNVVALEGHFEMWYPTPENPIIFLPNAITTNGEPSNLIDLVKSIFEEKDVNQEGKQEKLNASFERIASNVRWWSKLPTNGQGFLYNILLERFIENLDQNSENKKISFVLYSSS